MFNFSRAALYGSSPRMWGTQTGLSWPCLLRRFIPTHVGNTKLPKPAKVSLTVHPHACGEHIYSFDKDETSIGSSPRMWGTRVDGSKPVRLRRFIPTHVGNTHWCRCRCRPGHECGSSPRMWGTRWPRSSRPLPERFIPTHVGNTGPRWGCLSADAVHPHACGEHGGVELFEGRVVRFIPTHVGSTKYQIGFYGSSSVHPHACGEHQILADLR